MADEGQKRADPGDAFREGVRAVSGIIGAFKDAIEQTFNELSDQGDMSPERARDAARDAMRRAQEAVEDMRTRVDFVTRKEFDAVRAEIAALRLEVERHAAQGGHHTRSTGGQAQTGAPAADSPPATGGGTSGGTGGAGTGMGDGSPGL
jgi:polyhydroxyalkanoate synthesis regulator phasin